MGVELSSANATPPITVQPKRPDGGRVSIAGTLSQWISGLLIVAPFAGGPTTIEVEGTLNEQPYVELTVNMMRDFGLEVGVADDWRRFEIEPDQSRPPGRDHPPPDIGSLAFGLAATSIHPADVFFQGVTEIDGATGRPPRGPLPRRGRRDGAADGARPGGGRGPRPPRRGAAARGRGRLPADARHAAGAGDDGPVRRGRDPLLQRRPRAAEGVRPGRLDAAAEPDGRRRRRAGRRAGGARDRRRPDAAPPLQLQRPPRPHGAGGGGLARRAARAR